MSNNKALWARAFTTDPRAVKAITGKQYAGNSPKPYWIVERLTDEFGPAGIGWGFQILNERFERFSDTDTLHIAAVRFWYVLDGQRGELEQIGQTKSSYTTSSGKFMLDEDAPKKSVTDALVKCASYLGFAGDIFSGRWDDSKYVAEAGKEWKRRESEVEDESAKQAEPVVTKPAAGAVKKDRSLVHKPTDGAADGFTEEQLQNLQEIAMYLIDCHKSGKDLEAIRFCNEPSNFAHSDEKVYVWSQLAAYPTLRSAINANKTKAVAA